MVRVPRFGRLRIPKSLPQRWRARLRAQRRWWRQRGRSSAEGEVLFPVVGRGMVAVHTLVAPPASAPPSGAPSGPRIAILHATAGSGHKRAAQALAGAIERLAPGAVVREVDTLVFASRFYRSTYAATYNTIAAKAPKLWGALYHSWAQARVNRGTAPVRLALDRLNLRRLVRVVDRDRPDAVVCTHFLPVEALSHVRGAGRLGVPLYCVITDFAAHPFWAFPHVDRYFVASDQVADELSGLGVARDRIEVSGIPVDLRFAETVGRAAARQHLDLDPQRPMVLVMGGGSGVGPLGELAERLIGIAGNPHVIVVCGTNASLRLQLERLSEARPERLRVMGFTDDIDLLLEACDIVVSKAGGLTCSEALVKRAPLVVFKPTPGQEVRNVEYLETAGAAVHADTVEQVEATVTRWLAHPDVREQVRQAAGRIARPRAAEAIARQVLEPLRVTR